MHLRKHDLLQMDDEWLKKLQAELFLEVSKRLLHDVKELQDRLNQSPTNSSRPPTSRAPWEKPRDAAGEASDARVENPPESAAEPATDAADSTAEPVKANVTPSSSPKGSSKPRGKQPCCPGHGRTQKLAITDTCEYRPERCAACGEALAADAWS
jgi:transposase